MGIRPGVGQLLGGTLPGRVAQRTQGFTARRRGELSAHALGILQPAEVLDQA